MTRLVTVPATRECIMDMTNLRGRGTEAKENITKNKMAGSKLVRIIMRCCQC